MSFLFSVSSYADNKVFVFSEFMDDSFRKSVMQTLDVSVQSMKVGDNYLFISSPSNTKCDFKATQDNARATYKEYVGLYYKPNTACSKVMSFIFSGKSQNKSNVVNIPSAINAVIDGTQAFKKYDIVFFSSPIYVDESIDFSKGYPSLGYLGDDAKFISGFSKSFSNSVSGGDVKAHILYPKDVEKSYIVSTEGALVHSKRIQYFWREFLRSRSIELKSYNPIDSGLSNVGLVMPVDVEYDKSRNAIYFIDLLEANKKSRALKGSKEILISSPTPYGSTQSVYQYQLQNHGQIDYIFLKEFDGDNDSGGKVKVVIIDEAGNSENHLLTPSGDDVYKEHRIKVNSTKSIASIALYPVNSMGAIDVLGGAWSLTELYVVFK